MSPPHQHHHHHHPQKQNNIILNSFKRIDIKTTAYLLHEKNISLFQIEKKGMTFLHNFAL